MDELNIILLCISGAMIPYFLSKKFALSIITASAGPSLIMGVILPEHLSTYFYGASFIGMASFKKFLPSEVFLASLLYFPITKFALIQGYGIGGTLGFCALVSLCLVYTCRNIYNNFKRLH